MESTVIIEAASERDVKLIASIFTANSHDPAIFLRSADDVSKNLKDFFVAKDTRGQIQGCAALHSYSPWLGEILSVAVLPELQGKGIGSRLVETCIQEARVKGIARLWLATAKPDFFARFEFKPISRWELPVFVIAFKLKQVYQQPLSRWLPALFGRFTFMEKKSDTDIA
jgi:amino-acid N-acetyltransferase